ncbi:methyltransferase domain-containing protein [Flavobacterium sp. CYK-55]|uniref:methyltransferase domain-containing protein n=1 Tax=Flavobacterium sp. CYK-55 TaxID=2835529 RepID=UPI001BCBF0A9|nr:methyltransferase domain-containing protein [Flavobacterium sp. CYK-55]MBS7788113.1 methyltransferase domain-containing protein [Flavobacterium sp. CYK-55]
MKKIDRWLQVERIRQAQKYITGNSILDIGCHRGELFEKTNLTGDGIDPKLNQKIQTPKYTLWPGKFPEDFTLEKKYNNVTLLAVLEHIPEDELAKYATALLPYLQPKGRVIITIPSPKVDAILKILLFLKLIDGMDVHNHQDFDRSLIQEIFTVNGYTLIAKKRFELGLNLLYVFEKNDS